MNTNDPSRQDRKHVKAIKGFYVHAVIFCLVNAGLLILNLTNPHSSWWSLWPTAGWGIGLACNWAAVFRRGHAQFLAGKRLGREEYLSR